MGASLGALPLGLADLATMSLGDVREFVVILRFFDEKNRGNFWEVTIFCQKYDFRVFLEIPSENLKFLEK